MYRQLNLAHLESKVRLNCLRRYGHMERSDKWIQKYTHLEMMIVKPCKTWSETVTQGFKAWNIDANNE